MTSDGRPHSDSSPRADPPLLSLSLWPNRSMTWRGIVAVMVLVTVGLSLPLAGLHGTRAAWGMLPFMAGTLMLLAWAIARNFRDGRLHEEVRLWPDLITVERWELDGTIRRWHANPHWVRLALHENGRIEKYLTLTGNGREIELGAFLSPEEREALHAELGRAFSALRLTPAPLPPGDRRP